MGKRILLYVPANSFQQAEMNSPKFHTNENKPPNGSLLFLYIAYKSTYKTILLYQKIFN